MATRFVFNPSCLPILAAGGGGVSTELAKKGEAVEDAAKAAAPVDTGTLRASITSEVVVEGGRVRLRTGSTVLYARFQNYGTQYVPALEFIAAGLEELK